MLGLGSSSQLGIGIAVYLQDRFSGQAAKINQQLLAMRKNSQSAVMGAMRDYRNNAATIAVGAAGVTMGMYNMAQAGAEFQHRINQVAIIGGRELKRSRQDLTRYATEMSKTFTRTPTEIAAAMFENVKAGITGGLEEITKYQIAVSTAVDEKLEGSEGVAEKLLGIMNAYDLSFTRFKDIANATTSVANATISNVRDIGEAMQYTAFTAKQFNIPFEMTLAMIGKLSQSKIFGSSAGTAVNNMLLQLSQTLGPFATPKSQKAWGMLGLDLNQMRNFANTGRIDQVILALDKATKGMDPITRNDLLFRLFNRRGGRGLLGLFDSQSGNKSIGGLYDAAKQGERDDTVMKQSRAMMNDLYSDLKFIGQGFARFRNAFAEAAGPTLRVMGRVLIAVLKVFESILKTPIGKVLAGIVVVGAPLIAIMFGLRAAALTATIALRGFAMSSSVGGFRGLMGAGMNMIGMSRFGQYGGQFTRNAAGRLMVGAGQTVNFGGKIYKGGQMLPQAFATAMGLSSASNMFGAAGGIGSKVTGFLGKAGPWLGRIAGFGLRWLPVIGWIWTGFEVVKGIYGLLNSRDKEENSRPKLDPMLIEYYRSLDINSGGPGMSDKFYNKYGMSRREAMEKGQLNQQINVYTDGKLAMTNTINQDIENQMNSVLNFNMEDYQ